jgi:putative SOS response-associated peptidase YedK
MCGRYKQTTKAAELGVLFSAVVDAAFVDDAERLDRPRFNAAPTDRLPIVRVHDAHRALRPARWGLVPAWAKDEKIGASLLNARSETVFEKPAFKDALHKRRCLVPMDGFYEWKTEGKLKQPFLFSFTDDRPFALAGLWSTWKGPAGPVESFTILTTEANALVATLHDRMPVIVAEQDYYEWLDPARSTVDLDRLRAPRAWPGLLMRPVSRRLGNVRFDDPALLVAEDAPLGADGAPDGAAAPAVGAQATTGTTPETPAKTTTKKKKKPGPQQGTLL